MIGGMLRVDPPADRRSWGILVARGIAEEPVDRAGPVENAGAVLTENGSKNAFPTRSLDAHSTRAHTLHRPSLVLS